jgi:hypothetical protein
MLNFIQIFPVRVALSHVDGHKHWHDENKIRFSQMLSESAYKLEVCAKRNNTGALVRLLYLDFLLVSYAFIWFKTKDS